VAAGAEVAGGEGQMMAETIGSIGRRETTYEGDESPKT
jgi:hypothetical protein